MINMQTGCSAFIIIKYSSNAHLLELVLIAVHDSDSQNELFSVVVIENTVQVISKTLQKKKQVSLGRTS